MNIFVLDTDVEKCAKDHCDKHCVKMILETAQLLCGVHWSTGGDAPYRLSHKNHPCSIWARESYSNYVWLTDLGFALCNEYQNRYGKIHKSKAILEWCLVNRPNIPDVGLTPQPKAMPDEYKVDDIIESYRNYYRQGKKDILSWKTGYKPEWL
jgi:hypothetical protein